MLLSRPACRTRYSAIPDAILRVWIEDKYAGTQSPGEHVQFQIGPIGNPVALVGNMLGVVQSASTTPRNRPPGTDLRPLGTADVYRPFGVGGPVYDKENGSLAEDNVRDPHRIR